MLDPKESIALEDIYYKRHIAIGIPSMYGQYIEPKFEALGLMFRLEKTASKLMIHLLHSINLEYITALSEGGDPIISRDFINDIFKKAAGGAQKDFLIFSEDQNVSSDLMGCPAAVVIEGHENHTRTGFLSLDAETLQRYGINASQDITG